MHEESGKRSRSAEYLSPFDERSAADRCGERTARHSAPWTRSRLPNRICGRRNFSIAQFMSRERAEPVWVNAVLEFWFDELGEAHWFAENEGIDAQVRSRFLPLHQQLLAHDGCVAETPRALLAAVIVLDQFSRNLFRGTPQAFAADSIARRLSRSAIGQGADTAMTAAQRLFLYMPFEHSEDREDQAHAVELIARLGNEEWTRHAIAHRAIIDRFGRFPHRNAILNRASSAEEVALLQQPADW